MHKLYHGLIPAWGEETASHTLCHFAVGYGLYPEPSKPSGTVSQEHFSREGIPAGRGDPVGTPPEVAGTAAFPSAPSDRITGQSPLHCLC